ncbi:PKD domain-containing protein, partial [Brumimicrobium salinarum]|uniref:PKD domain-containing protein n=1 Tax=Brumimicrobium salinarum TaxID=2058658 RepID=UPI001F0C82C1
MITSSLPVTVMQYAEGVSCGGPGDPFQVLLYPIEQSLESITFNAFQTPLVNDFWINILVETVDVPNVVLDGTNIAVSFSPFPSDPSYSYARVNVTQGDHTLNTPGGSLATVYGWGNAESFGYCAGAALKDLTNDFAIISSPTCTDDVIQFEAIPDPSTSGFSWDYGDGSPTQTGINSTHNFANAGTFDVTLTKHKTGACDVQIVKPVDIFELPIDITQPDTAVCIGSTIDLNIPVSDTFVVERINDCGDITYNRIHIQYDSIYWSTGDVGRNIQVTPTSDTMIYAYGEQFGSICRAVDSVFIEVIEPLADFAFNDACQTDSICLTDQSTSSAPYNISRYSIDGNLLVNNELDYCFLNNVPGNYDIELFIETDIGCKDSITKTVEVFSQPDADFDFVNACDQESIQFQSTAVPNIGSIIDYQWDIDTDGTTDYSVANFGHTYTQDGLFDVEHIVINSHGCSDTIVKEISVYALPNAVFTVDAVCEDTTTTFTNTSNVNPVDADVITNYEWTFGDGNSSSLENPNHDYLTENIYNAKLLVITNHGCRDSVTHPVSVFPQPSVGFTATNACLGFENVFDDETTISNAYTTNTLTTWEWSFDDGNGSVNQNTNHLYSGSGIYNVQLIVGTDNGCVDSITQQVEVYNQPTADFNFTNACDHEDVEMVSTANSNGGTIDHYFWDIDNNGNVDYTINPAAH